MRKLFAINTFEFAAHDCRASDIALVRLGRHGQKNVLFKPKPGPGPRKLVLPFPSTAFGPGSGSPASAQCTRTTYKSQCDHTTTRIKRSAVARSGALATKNNNTSKKKKKKLHVLKSGSVTRSYKI